MTFTTAAEQLAQQHGATGWRIWIASPQTGEQTIASGDAMVDLHFRAAASRRFCVGTQEVPLLGNARFRPLARPYECAPPAPDRRSRRLVMRPLSHR